MPLLIANLLLAGIPSVIVVGGLIRRDLRRKEPSGLVLPAFLVGFLAVLPALVLVLFFRTYEALLSSPLKNFVKAFLIAAAVEEGVKYAAVRLIFYRRREFRNIADGVVIAVAGGLGFAFFENIFFSMGSSLILLVRGFTSVPLHAAASGILGYYIGLSKFTHRPHFGRGLLLAILIHGCYDLLLFFDSWVAFLTIPFLLFFLGLTRRYFRRAEKKDAEEGRG